MSDKITIDLPPILSLLGLLFIGLKLTNNIDWSWWWVLLPIYGPAAAVLGLTLFLYIGSFVVMGLAIIFIPIVDWITERKYR